MTLFLFSLAFCYNLSMKKYLATFLLFSWPLLSLAKSLDNKVVFIPQAPLKEWSDKRFQDGCEEASVLMAIKWAKAEKTKVNLKTFREEIVKMSAWEEKTYKNYHDTSAADTAQRLLKEYSKFTKYEVKTISSSSELVTILEQGKIIIVPTNGQLLKNPNFTAPGPDRHMLVIKGYDYKKKEFITNDPGTKKGENYRYKEAVLLNAIADYKTGQHDSLDGYRRDKNIIIISKIK